MSERTLVERLPAPRDVYEILLATYESWRNDRTIRLGAGLAYYGLFSLSSVLAVALGLFRIIGQSSAIEEALVTRLEEVFGADAAASVTQFIAKLDGDAGTQLGLIGLGSLLVTGSLFFLALEDALNQIWDVPVRSGIRNSIRRRLISLLVLFCAAATLVASFAVQAATSLLEALIPGSTAGQSLIATALTSSLTWSVLGVALALLFRYLPNTTVRWRPVIIASIVTAILVVVGTALIGIYLRGPGASSLGGVVSTPIAVLVWIYYEAQIVLAGAQLAKVLQERPRVVAMAN